MYQYRVFWGHPYIFTKLNPLVSEQLFKLCVVYMDVPFISMDDRHEQSSTLVTSQLPTNQWHGSIGDTTLADAILDRLMHNAHRLNLKGESMRKKLGKLEANEHLY